MRNRFHPWKLSKDKDGLEHTTGYFIPFDECQTSAEVLDWLMQVESKVWTEDDKCLTLAMLVSAFAHYLDPQSNLCSFGQERGPVRWGRDRHINTR